MTDAHGLSVKAINGYDLSHVSLAGAFASARHHSHYHAPAHLQDAEEESISCICGFADDDGWTVACDACNRWQHQSCYYPDFDERSLPEDLSHYCVECKPRTVDVTRARLRQQEKRGPAEILANGIKRHPSKSHKKKVKEPTGPHTNGWSLDKFRHDRNSASPRDQPPPAKRPKTAHRTSDSASTTTTIKGHSRKRNASNVNNHRRSLSRSPDSPVEQYSDEFLQCYQEDDWSVADANLHNSIGVTNALTEWLEALDDDFRSLHRSAKGDILSRWDSTIDDIPRAEIDIVENQDTTVAYNGQHPTWKALTVKEPVAIGGFIGELRGHIGFKRDYQSEDANRWSRLRHPEPFVFFHPKLPLVIDARNEGTEMRYIRRSCQPNARLQILVTDNVDYHFCFIASQQLEPGDEVAVGWDTADGLPELTMKPGLTEDELEVISGWVSTVLANCGPCACSLPEHECMMSRFDRRARGVQDPKASKSKKRKVGQHISPLNTQVNSRSSSEARKVEHDEDGTDSRSASGSAGRGSASRDITPNTHYSSNGTSSGAPELSERERKKLAKEEEIFRKQEEEQGKQAKKKRHSAGSSLSTPSATASKQLGFPTHQGSKYVDVGMSKQTGIPTKGVPGRRSKTSKSTPKPVASIVKRIKPVYVNAETQCDMDQEDAALRALTPSSRRPFKSRHHKLLEMCARNNRALATKHQLSRTTTPKPARDSSNVCDKVVTHSSVVPDVESQPSSRQPPLHGFCRDVEMADSSTLNDDRTSSPIVLAGSTAKDAVNESKTQVSAELPDPSWAQNLASSVEPEAPFAAHSKLENMHLDMPPPASNPFAPPLAPSAVDSSTAGVVQSPATLPPGPLFSPAVAAAVNPSPARKKLSLSDYTRRKAKVQDTEPKNDRESSPASTTSGPVVPPLQPSSSAEVRAPESAIDEDVKMEDIVSEPGKT